LSEGNRILKVLVWNRAFELVNFLNELWVWLPNINKQICAVPMVSIKCFNQILTPISVVLSGKFSQDSDQKELDVKYTKGFFVGKICKSLYILRGKSQKLSYLDTEFMEVDRTKGDPKKNHFAGDI
jgi:hypothetical protein